ncbi:hypothetical protein IMSHALPRED_008310 [Imshaugia aleurites]|uniref:Uncharacterized protein n=1 Tax=Imshaugia aleurites TaxID=172621 RepID=A0A8H3FUC0_9LECA|nr:hypothetical protein IMSHALPRED_008310 [Imshaugia aleurites]
MSSTPNNPPQPTPLPPLSSLVRPAHMVSLFRMNEQRKQYWFLRCNQLWETLLTNSQHSALHREAYRKLVVLTQIIKQGLLKQKEKELAADAARQAQGTQRALEQAAFQTLMQQVSGRQPIPAWQPLPAFADFEAGPSASRDTAAAQVAVTVPLASDQDAKLAVDDVETALTLLDIDVRKTSLEDLHAGLTILDLPEGVHSKVDDYLRTVFCKPKPGKEKVGHVAVDWSVGASGRR